MKQENGAELLGMNDPRSASIGIIYVSPTDDRRSVLAAILTQEKLGRKQIAIVLPPQNKAFQRPSDFDDLKTIRRNLEAQIVFIAPSGPGPAEFARQRHFAVYSTLENYATALRDGNAGGGVKKGGWLFHRGKPKFLGATPAAASAPPQSSMPHTGEEEDDQEIHTDPLKSAGRGAAAFGAGMLAADMLKRGPVDDDHTRMFPIHYDDDGDALPPTTGPNTGQGQSGAGQGQAGAGQAQGIAPTDTHGPTSVGAGLAPALPPTNERSPIDKRSTNVAGAVTPQGRAVQDSAGGTVEAAKPGGVVENGGTNPGGPKIIELNPVRQKVTAKLSPAELAAANQPPAAPASANVGAKANRPRTTGKMAAAAMVGAGVGAASMAAGPGAQQRVGGVGNFPPPPGPGFGGRGGGPNRGPRPRRGLVALVIAIILVLLIGGGLGAAAFMNPSMFKQASSVFSGGGTTVNITPDSKLISNNYVIVGVPGTPDPNQRQIAVRSLTASAKSTPKTVNATGHTQTPGTVARGKLTFTNGSFSPYTVAAGTVINSSNGVAVITDAPAFIPAATPPTGPNGQFTVSAHATVVGANGNIPAMSISKSCCAANFIFVENAASFTGGQDPQNYNFVQQSDVDGVANPLKSSVSAQAQASLQGQLHTGEQFVAQNGSNPCPASVSTDSPVGPHGVNVNSVTVTVTATCNALAYDHAGLQTMVANLLASKANNDIGSTYKLVGQIVMHTTVQNIDQQGNVSLLVSAKGVWVAQINDAEKTALAKAIAGKTVAEAQDILAGRKDIAHADIQGNGGNVLPSDPNQIKIVIQNVPGVQDTATPAPGGSPVNIPNGTQTPLPGNG